MYFYLATFYLIFAGILSYFGLYGNWHKTIFQFTYGMVWDPSSLYIASAIVLFENTYLPHAAHPGLPLIYLLHGIYKTFYLLSFSPSSFSTFCAENLYWMVLFARICISLCNLLSFVVVYKVALYYLRQPKHAFVATLAFATSFVSLFFINHVSIEPLMLIFTFGMLIFLLQYQDGFKKINLVGASLCCALGVLSKIAILTPLIVFAPIFIWLVRRNVRRFLTDSLIFLGVFVALFWLLSWPIDWQVFFRYWFQHTPGEPTFNSSQDWFTNLVYSLPGIVASIAKLVLQGLSPMVWLPMWTRDGIFNIAELTYMIVGIYGWKLYAKKAPVSKAPTQALLILTLMLLPIPLFKGGFNYFYVHLAILSVFFPIGLESILVKIKRQGVSLVTATLIIHIPTLIFIGYLKAYDIRQYTLRWQNYYLAMRGIEPGERIGLWQDYTTTNLITGYLHNYVSVDSQFMNAVFQIFTDAKLDLADVEKRKIGAIIIGGGYDSKLYFKKDFGEIISLPK